MYFPIKIVTSVGCCLYASGAMGTEPSSRYLFLDPSFILESKNVTLGVNPPKKQEIVVRRDRPWEGMMISFWLTAMEDEGQLRLWYLCRDMEEEPNVVYAESKDGVHWTKPDLNIASYQGSTKNNLVGLGKFDGIIYRDPAAASPAEKYVHIGNVDLPKDKIKGVVRFTSPDGLHWKPDTRPLLPFRSDTQNVFFWDQNQGHYVVYLRGWDMKPGWNWRIRTVVRLTAKSLQNPLPVQPSGLGNDPGSSMRLARIVNEFPVVLAADQQDPGNSDVYNISAQPYPLDPRWYVGFPSFFERKNTLSDGTLNVQFVGSKDGITWHRYNRKPYIDRGPAGSDSESMVFMSPSMIIRGDEIWQYGTGYRFKHGDSAERKKAGGDGAIYRYVQRIDGFVSADFGDVPGELVTAPVHVGGTRLLLNVAVSASGELRVGLLDASGRPMVGFEDKQCTPVRGDSTHAEVSWDASAVSALQGKEVRFHFKGRQAKLFSFFFRDAGETKPNRNGE